MNKCFTCGCPTTRRRIMGIALCAKCHPRTEEDIQLEKLARSLGRECALLVDNIVNEVLNKHKEN